MSIYEHLAEQMLSSMDTHRHMPPEPVSSTVRGEMAVLRFLGVSGGSLSAGAIASQLSMTTSRIAAVLNSLEKKEMILRSPDPCDKRRVLVTLTEKGEQYRLKRRNEAKTHLSYLLEQLGEEDAATFVRLVSRLHNIHSNSLPDKEV